MDIFLSLCIFFAAVVIHEFSHAFVANRCGDSTARRSGRLTLNPLAHIDPFGTILLPLFLILMQAPVLFGWAKPVPINFASLRNPRRDMVMVGLAGPVANFLSAIVISILIKYVFFNQGLIFKFLDSFMAISVVLGVFNLIPIPPLDGSRVLLGLLPRELAMRYASLERYGFLIIFALVYMGVLDRIVWPITTKMLQILTHL
jgi:Zn-dependent protease